MPETINVGDILVDREDAANEETETFTVIKIEGGVVHLKGKRSTQTIDLESIGEFFVARPAT